MRSVKSRIMSFVIPYIIVLGSYIVFHNIWNFNENYGFISAGLLALLYLIIGIPLYFGFRKKNDDFAKGVLCGVLSIVIFLFTIGGCGVFRTYG